MARFFIDRPVFAWVLAIMVMLAGVLAINTLSVAQYPTIAPPAISISANYPGASAKTLEDTVTQVIEQKMTGLDGLMYISSNSSAAGSVNITLTFRSGTNPDLAQVQVQNKLSLATSSLPEEVQRQGITVSKSSSNFMMMVALISEDGSMSSADLSDYTVANLLDSVSRVNGVGDITVFGSQYAMRIWLDPDKLQTLKLTPADISSAVTAQNAQVSAGQIGALPAVDGQQINATITAKSRLKTVDEFKQILLRTNSDGSTVRLSDVARVELGSESYTSRTRYAGKPAAGLAIKLATGANALETHDAVLKRIEELKPFFPKGMTTVVPYDTTPFVRIAIEDVIKTLLEAVVLVFLVMYLFLQNFRATLIPTIAVPVVLLGTFGVLYAFGYSINTLTMFAMVLAIGLLVDDAIVVVENVERVMSEDSRMSPKEATRRSMDQIGNALIGVALSLAAVFVPMAFFGGSTGVIYRQFSVTIVAAMTLSVLTALILTPALCATLLKPSDAQHQEKRGFFGWFNRNFNRSNQLYQGAVGKIIHRGKRYLIIYAALSACMALAYTRLPGGFLPAEDQGYFFLMVQLPANASQERTLQAIEQVERYFAENEKEGVKSVFSAAGFSFSGSGQNVGMGFIDLKPWDERGSGRNSAQAIANRAMGALANIREASVFAFVPPAVSELGNASGFDMMLQDRGNVGHDGLIAARNQLMQLAAKDPAVTAVRPNGLEDTPQLSLKIDEHKAAALGISLSDINDLLTAAWGGSYINDFIDKGRVKKVYMQADARFRMQPDDLKRWYVRNDKGTMVRFDAFASAEWSYGSPRLERYNGMPSINIQGSATGSTGDAMTAMEKLAAQLPNGVGFEWTGISLQEKQAGSQALLLYALSILIVFLCLAALYESWGIPLAVMMVVPLGVLGAVLASLLLGKMNDIYFQVGLLTTVGLASKNAILIIEFAKEQVEAGQMPLEAALQAARMRLRPILMTSMAFMLGMLPMFLASGAGSGAQNALATAVIGGMLSSTFLAIFFVPLFFVTVMGLSQRHRNAGTVVLRDR